jgi:ABC transporter substrate binding protein
VGCPRFRAAAFCRRGIVDGSRACVASCGSTACCRHTQISPRNYPGSRSQRQPNNQNLSLEIRSAEGKLDRLPLLAVELVRAGVDVIVAGGGEAPLRAALQATNTIPIVAIAVDYDPIASGLVSSLARPGGNITGVFLQQLELTAKRLELLTTNASP